MSATDSPDNLLFVRFDCTPHQGATTHKKHELLPTSVPGGHLSKGAVWSHLTFEGLLKYQFEGETCETRVAKLEVVHVDENMRKVKTWYNLMPLDCSVPSYHGHTRLDEAKHSGVLGLKITARKDVGDTTVDELVYAAGLSVITNPTTEQSDLSGSYPIQSYAFLEEIKTKVSHACFSDERAVFKMCEYIDKVASQPVAHSTTPWGFAKELGKAKAVKIFAAEMKHDRAIKHFKWCQVQRDLYAQYHEIHTVHMTQGAPENVDEPFMMDGEYEYEEWQEKACEDVERMLSEARQSEYRAMKELQQAKEWHEMSVRSAKADKKRKVDDEARWSKKRAKREARLDGKFCQFSNGETNHRGEKRKRVDTYMVIAGDYENKVGKHTGRDCDDGSKILIKLTEGYEEGKVITVDQDNLDWADDVDEDARQEEQAFKLRCKRVREHFKNAASVALDSGDKPDDAVHTYNNLYHRFHQSQWTWYFDQADKAWADKPEPAEMIRLVKTYCEKEYWDFSFNPRNSGYGDYGSYGDTE